MQLAPQGFVEIAGARLEYGFHGPQPDAAPTLVLLHEGLGCVGLWGDFPRRLAEASGCGVFAYSRAGYGASDPVSLPRPLDYMQRAGLHELPLLLDAIDFRRGCLIGHSDGASIAAVHAGGVRDRRVAGISLIAPHFFTEEFGLIEIAKARDAYRVTDLRQKLARWHVHVDVAFCGWNDAWLDPSFPVEFELRGFLPAIACPVQLVQGAMDQYGTLTQLDEAVALICAPVGRVVLPGVKHSPHREAPDMLIAALVPFIASVLQR